MSKRFILPMLSMCMVGILSGPVRADDWSSTPINWNGMQQSGSGDCSPTVQQQQQANQIAQIDGATAIAKQFYDVLPPGSFNKLSCLDNLFNSGGLNLIFNPPSLTQVINMLKQAVCNVVNAEVQKVMQPLSQMLSSSGSLPLGQVIPGLNLGSLGMGISVSPSFGNSNGSLINTNINSVLSRPFGFNPAASPSLFGNSNAGGSSGPAITNSVIGGGDTSSLFGNSNGTSP